MKRLLAFSGALLFALLVLVPAARAAEPMANTGRVLISTQGDVTIPAGDQADVVVIVQGNVNVQGAVNTLVVIEGTANLTGAELETVVAIRGQVEVADGTVIHGAVQRLDSIVHQSGSGRIEGGIADLAGSFLQASAVLAPALILLWLGFGLATIIAALTLAGLASRQVRKAGRLISTEPLMTGLAGFVGVIVIPICAVLLMVTIIGAPLGLGVLLQVLPLLAYVGYLVAAIWVGEWILRRTTSAPERERPYLAAVLGVVILGFIGLVPVLGLIATIASLLGFGALLRMAWRTLRGAPRPVVGAAMSLPAPTGA
jgi:hypothetical protein